MATKQDVQNLIEGYRQAELTIIELLREIAVEAAGTRDWYQGQARALRELLAEARAVLAQAEPSQADLEEVLNKGWADGWGETAPGQPAPTINTAAMTAVATEQSAAFTAAGFSILRQTQDAFREVARVAVSGQIASGADRNRALQNILNDFAANGITAYRDSAGRKWGIDTYGEMVLRTGVNRAQNDGRLRGYQASGVSLVHCSQHRGADDHCLPFQNRILSTDGAAGDRVVVSPITGEEVTVHVAATLADAMAHGLLHVNAVLGGDQSLGTFGGSVSGSKGTYSGPAITIRTAQGHEVTVSPHHPVMTGRGWIGAKFVREGDYVFSTGEARSSTSLAGFGASDLDNMPASVEDEFDALVSRLPVMSTPATGHNFDDDRQFLEGEVDVVMPDDMLLFVPDPQVCKETGETVFDGADVSGFGVAGDRCLNSNGRVVLPPPIFRTLTNSDTAGLEPAPNGRIRGIEYWGEFLGGPTGLIHLHNEVSAKMDVFAQGDSERVEFAPYCRVGDSQNPGTVALAVPGGVKAEQVVAVDVVEFSGYAYDFQTGSGVYAVGSILMHNCRHTLTAYTPGLPLPDDVNATEEDFHVEQRQRQIERHIRSWKRAEAASMDEGRAAYCRRKVRQWQGAQRDHIKANPWLVRRYDRERLWSGDASKGRKVTNKRG